MQVDVSVRLSQVVMYETSEVHCFGKRIGEATAVKRWTGIWAWLWLDI